METPRYYEHDESAGNLVLSYAAAVAEDLRNPEVRLKGRALLMSVRIAEACKVMTDDTSSRPDKVADLLDEAEEIYGRVQRRSSNISMDHAYVGEVVLPLLRDTDHQGPDGIRGRTHTVTMNRVRESLSTMDRIFDGEECRYPFDTYAGIHIEHTALALVSRLQHPRILALPALPHQEDTNTSRLAPYHCDFIVIESSSKNLPEKAAPETEARLIVHRVQVKSDCLGYCGRPEPPHDADAEALLRHARSTKRYDIEQAKDRRKARALYTPDVVLISGCCDLGIRTESVDRSSFTVARMLIDEYDEVGEPLERQERALKLDSVSNSLLLTITGMPDRRGTYSSSSGPPPRRRGRRRSRAAST